MLLSSKHVNRSALQLHKKSTRYNNTNTPISQRVKRIPSDVHVRSTNNSITSVPAKPKIEGASTDLGTIYKRLGQLALPYWTDPEVGSSARWRLAGVVGLTLATTAVSVAFNFLGRDFFNALSEKNEELFALQLIKYLGAFVVGIPVFVLKSYYQNKLALEWRAWMTDRLMEDYFANRTFYTLQAQSTVDNPDQRIASDAGAFTATAVNLSLVMLNAVLDLVSFSGILYGIYPPLFAALLAYSFTGTGLSLWLGKPLVGLNFAQEAREADLRYGLVRVRENAEAVAFYRGEEDEKTLLQARLQAAVSNYMGLLVASRNLDFFTSFYRYLIQLLPAAVVAPLFFQGKIEFGVINQSQSAFNHVLNDLSLIVYQFESLAGFSAVIDRLGQFQEAMETSKKGAAGALASDGTNTANNNNTSKEAIDVEVSAALPGVTVQYLGDAVAGIGSGGALPGNAILQLEGLSVITPDAENLLVEDLDLTLPSGTSLLIMGPSGAGKTSILRTLAGLWTAGRGAVRIACSQSQAMFLPQKPYMVLGSLRDQILYPAYQVDAEKAVQAVVAAESGHAPASSNTNITNGSSSASSPSSSKQAAPSDAEIEKVLRKVRLGHLLSRHAEPGKSSLDVVTDWASSLSLGEQQRIAWARLLLAKPKLALLDEATSALDQATEEELYQVLSESGITYASVGHRGTLKKFHTHILNLAPSAIRSTQGSESDTSSVEQQQDTAKVASNTWEVVAVK